MNKMRIILSIGASIILSGCVGFGHDPHQLFLEQRQMAIGKNVSVFIAYYGEPIEESLLENGNLEGKWPYSAYFKDSVACFVFYEYDTKENIIIRWRYIGSKKNCRPIY